MLTALSEDTENLDDLTDGILIHADNFQALNLLQTRYREQVKCIYIDPPYNSPSSEIVYKNSYKHSSWLSLMNSRVDISKTLLSSRGNLICAIDENEYTRLSMALKEIFTEPSFEHNTIIVRHNTKGIQGGYISINNEFSIVISHTGDKSNGKPIPKEKREYVNFRNWGGESERHSAKNCFYPIWVKEMQIIGYGEVPPDNFHPRHNEELDDDIIAVYPIDANGIERKWTYARQSVKSIQHLLKVEKLKNGNLEIKKTRDTERYKTVWSESKYIAGDYGSKILNNIIGKKLFDFPKSLHTVIDSLRMCTQKENTILDYFAGSGTTAHAVINLNREDGGKRKYILVEQGEYFDTVLKPRVQKVIYSDNWKNGEPQADKDGHFNGVSQMVKVLKLESYEDTLNNLALPQKSLLDTLPQSAQSDYRLHYMLDTESKDSLLSTQHFTRPFDYRLDIATDSAGASETTTIDLVETFNYLLGLTVLRMQDYRHSEGFVFIEGILPQHRDKAKPPTTLIIWRDCATWGEEKLGKLMDKKGINPNSASCKNTYHSVYLNGDNTVITTWQDNKDRTKSLNMRVIEEEFLRLMFAGES